MIIIVVILIIMFYILITYNILVKNRLRVHQAKSGIDVYLKQRFDLIPNLVECVKKYSEHEQKTFTEIAKLRAEYYKNKDLNTGRELNSKFNNVIAVVENYPELKADEQFLMLQKTLSKMENQLQAARRLYNIEVTSLNTKIEVFPSNLIAVAFNFQKENLFELDDDIEKNNVQINISKDE